MKASSIIKYLESYIKEYGDQEVYVWADHSQTDSLVRSVDYTDVDPSCGNESPFEGISIYGE